MKLLASAIAVGAVLTGAGCLPSGQQGQQNLTPVAAAPEPSAYRTISVPTAQAFARYCLSKRNTPDAWPKGETFRHASGDGNVKAAMRWMKFHKPMEAYRLDAIAFDEINQFLNPTGEDEIQVCKLTTGPIPHGQKALAEALGFEIARRGPNDDGTIWAQQRQSWTALVSPDERSLLLMTQQPRGYKEFEASLIVATPKRPDTTTLARRYDAARQRHPGWTPPPRFMEATLAAYDSRLPAVMAQWAAYHAEQNAKSAARIAERKRQWAEEDARKPSAFAMALGQVATRLDETNRQMRERQEILDEARHAATVERAERAEHGGRDGRGERDGGAALSLTGCPTRSIDPPAAYAGRITPLTYNSCDEGAEARTRSRMNDWVASLRRQDAAAARPRPSTRVEEKPQPRPCQNLKPGDICTASK